MLLLSVEEEEEEEERSAMPVKMIGRPLSLFPTVDLQWWETSMHLRHIVVEDREGVLVPKCLQHHPR
jgi:hypothetical protein